MAFPTPTHQSAPLATFGAMAQGKRAFGTVRPHHDGRGWLIDVRPHEWIGTAGGIRIRNKKLAEGVLQAIRVELARGISIEAALEPWLPVSAKRAPVLGTYAKWIEHKRRQESAGDRSKTTIDEFDRYSREGGELEFRRDTSIYEIDYAGE